MQQSASLLQFPVARPDITPARLARPANVRVARRIATTCAWSRERYEQMFVDELPTIRRLVARLARHYRLSTADAEDLTSEVQMRIIRDNYAVLRKFRSRCKLRTFLNVAIRRIVLDRLNAQWGKWRPSARSRRLGAAAVRFEQLTVRDGLNFEEAIEVLTTEGQRPDRGAFERLHGGVRRRGRPRFVSDVSGLEIAANSPSSDDGLAVESAQRTVDRACDVVRTELTTATAEERCILRMRFSEGLSIADIARRLAIDQKTLYRTVPRILQRLRSALEHSGVGAHEVLSALTRNEVNLQNVYVTSNLVAMPTPALRSLSPSR